MTIDFKGHRFIIEANVDLREAPDQDLVEITEMLWRAEDNRLVDVRNLILDFLTSNEVQELDELIINTFRDENNL